MWGGNGRRGAGAREIHFWRWLPPAEPAEKSNRNGRKMQIRRRCKVMNGGVSAAVANTRKGNQ